MLLDSIVALWSMEEGIKDPAIAGFDDLAGLEYC